MTIPTRYSTFHRSTMLTCHPMSHLPSLSVGLLPLSSFGSGQFFLHLFRWNVEERLGRWEGTKSGAVPEKLMSLPKKVLAGEHRDNSKKGEVLILCNYVRTCFERTSNGFRIFSLQCACPALGTATSTCLSTGCRCNTPRRSQHGATSARRCSHFT